MTRRRLPSTVGRRAQVGHRVEAPGRISALQEADPRRVNPFQRKEFAVGCEVHGRPAEAPTQAIPFDDPAGQAVGTPQEIGRQLDLALGERPPDPGGRDRVAVGALLLQPDDGEAELRAEPRRGGRGRPRGPCRRRTGGRRRARGRPARPARNSRTNSSARVAANSVVNGMTAMRSIPAAARSRTFCSRVRSVAGARCGARTVEGMGLEGHQHRRQGESAGAGDDAIEHGALPAVDAVVVADGDHRRRGQIAGTERVGDDLHRAQATEAAISTPGVSTGPTIRPTRSLAKASVISTPGEGPGRAPSRR